MLTGRQLISLTCLSTTGIRLLWHPSLSHQYAALLPIIEEVSGPTHPATLTTRANLRFPTPRPVVGGVNIRAREPNAQWSTAHYRR